MSKWSTETRELIVIEKGEKWRSRTVAIVMAKEELAATEFISSSWARIFFTRATGLSGIEVSIKRWASHLMIVCERAKERRAHGEAGWRLVAPR